MAVRLTNNKTKNQQRTTRENTFNSSLYDDEIEIDVDPSQHSKSNSSDLEKINNKSKYVADIFHHQHILKLIK